MFKQRFQLNLLIVFFFSYFFISCDSKKEVYHDLIAMSNEVKSNSANFSSQEWDDYFTRLEDLHKRMDKYDYTPSERIEIGRLEGEIAAYVTKEAIESISNETLDILNEATGFIEGFKQTFENNH